MFYQGARSKLSVEQAVAQAKEKATCVTKEIARGPAEDSDVIAPPPPKPKQYEFLKKRTGALRAALARNVHQKGTSMDACVFGFGRQSWFYPDRLRTNARKL